MSYQEIPVDRAEGAGCLAGGPLRIETALSAVVAHALDVLAAGNIGFGTHQTPVGKLGHTEHVLQLHPLNCIHIDRQIPLMNLARFDAEQQHVEPGCALFLFLAGEFSFRPVELNLISL